jgi:hypothetical protein
LPLHEAPAYDCCCGIHALATPERAAAYLRSEGDKGAPAVQRVLGAVSLWGRVVEATNGWRASVAYPHRIIVPTGRLQRVVAAALWPYRPSPGAVAEALEAYGVPVELSESRSIAADRPLAVR